MSQFKPETHTITGTTEVDKTDIIRTDTNHTMLCGSRFHAAYGRLLFLISSGHA